MVKSLDPGPIIIGCFSNTVFSISSYSWFLGDWDLIVSLCENVEICG